MADPRDNYSPTESERLHVKAMQIGSTALRERIAAHHPQIVARLVARQLEQTHHV